MGLKRVIMHRARMDVVWASIVDMEGVASSMLQYHHLHYTICQTMVMEW